MGKVTVIVNNAQNVVKDDEGKRLEPYVQHELEETDRVKRMIAGGLVEKVREEDKDKKKEDEVPVFDPDR